MQRGGVRERQKLHGKHSSRAGGQDRSPNDRCGGETEGCETRELPAADTVAIDSPSADGGGQHSIADPRDPARRRPTPKNGPTPDANQPHSLSKPPASQRRRAERDADDTWRDPETLLENLSGLAAAGPTSKWATEVVRQIRALGLAVTGGSDESVAILERLAELDCQAPQLAAKIADKTLARKLKKVGFALGRRIDVWQEVVRLGVPQPIDSAMPEVDPQKLALCLAQIDSLVGDSPEGGNGGSICWSTP